MSELLLAVFEAADKIEKVEQLDEAGGVSAAARRAVYHADYVKSVKRGAPYRKYKRRKAKAA